MLLIPLLVQGDLVCFIFLDQHPDGFGHQLIFRFHRKRAASQDQSVEFFAQGAHSGSRLLRRRSGGRDRDDRSHGRSPSVKLLPCKWAAARPAFSLPMKATGRAVIEREGALKAGRKPDLSLVVLQEPSGQCANPLLGGSATAASGSRALRVSTCLFGLFPGQPLLVRKSRYIGGIRLAAEPCRSVAKTLFQRHRRFEYHETALLRG
jgi:hypothetical protein